MIRYDEEPLLSDRKLKENLLLLQKHFHKKTWSRHKTVTKAWLEFNKRASVTLYQAAQRIKCEEDGKDE